MLGWVCHCHWLVLVAWTWSTLTYQALARPPHQFGGPHQVGGAPKQWAQHSFANSSISSLSPLKASGSCWKCGIEAPGGIRLVYWEPDGAGGGGSNVTQKPSPDQPYTQVEDGFTYTSPSVYVIYSSLRGTAACSTESGLYAVGPSFSAKTIGYSSRFLAYGTLSIADAGCSEFVVVDGFHTIDFSSLYYNPITTTTTYKAGCAPYVNPRLSLPHELTNVDPRWESCEPLFYGAFDPPSVLTKASGGLAPSPVRAGQVTPPAEAQPMVESATAKPAVTPGPPVAAPTIDVGNNKPGSQGGQNFNPQETATPVSNNGPAPEAHNAATVQPHVDDTPSNPAPQPQQQAEKPSNNGQDGPVLAAGSTVGAQVQPSPPSVGPPKIPPSGSLGQIINSPFAPEQNDAKPAVKAGAGAEATPASPDSHGSAPVPSQVVVPVQMENGKPAFAIVQAQPADSGGSAVQVAALPTGVSSPGQPSVAPGQKESNIAGAQSTPSPGGTMKVTLNDGSTAEIPSADIIQPPQPQDNQGGTKGPGPNLQKVHLSAGAFIAVPGVNGASSSVAVQGGDYLLPSSAQNTPQKTLALLGGQTTAIPLATPSQAVTLQGGKVTNIPINAPAQILTLKDGTISTFSPIPDSTITLADGQVTSIPGANPANGPSNNFADTNTPLQILTFKNGQTTTVPVQVPSQVFTLQGGSVTTLSPSTPPTILTLANGQVSTISPISVTSVTLADGTVTSIPQSNPVAGSGEGFSNVPLQTLTLKNGQVTTVPVGPASQTFTLEGGKLTTLSAYSAPETLHLANGEITTISSSPLTAVTLANGQVTSIQANYTPSSASNEFLTIPDATISGKVYYTRLPIVQLQNAGFNQSQNVTAGENIASNLISSALATAKAVSGASSTTQTSIPTPSGTINNAIVSATSTSTVSASCRTRSALDVRLIFAIALTFLGLGVT